VKVYVAMIADRHADPEPEVFTTSEAAINYVERWAKAHARVPENIVEEEAEGWLFCLEYSPEGDSVWVVEKHLHEGDAP
jgi:hypothetical protein